MDKPKASDKKTRLVEARLREVLEILGIAESDSTRDTPARVARMLVDEVCGSAGPDALERLKSRMARFPNENRPHGSMVVVRKIAFSSWCAHHLLPFSGTVNIGYVPGEWLLGLSKFPRAVRHFSKMPQLQEYLVSDICDFIYGLTEACCVIVSATATHSCVACRGAESSCETVTCFERHRDTELAGERRKAFRDLGGFSFGQGAAP